MWKHWRKDGRWLSFFFLLTCRWCNSDVITHSCCYHELSIHLSIICLFPLLNTIWTPSTSFSSHPFQTTPHTILSISQSHNTPLTPIFSIHFTQSATESATPPISNKHSNLNQLTNPSSAISPFASGCVGSKNGESSPPRSPLSALR